MATQEISVIDYSGPQGSVELEYCEGATINRQTSKSRVKTMNRDRRAIGMQSGTPDVSVTLTIIPQLGTPEVDWHQAWHRKEVFSLTAEKGIDGIRELIQGCEVTSINDTYSESGEARQEVSVEALFSVNEPG